MLAGSITGLDIVTLVLAVIGALTGVASLAWSIASHVLSGGRVKVELLAGWIGPNGAVTVPIDEYLNATPPIGFGYDQPVLVVQVNNTGRLPVSITKWSVDVGGAKWLQLDSPINKPLPHGLDVGQEANWYADFASVRATALALSEVTGGTRRLSAHVQLGNGTTASSGLYSPHSLGF